MANVELLGDLLRNGLAHTRQRIPGDRPKVLEVASCLRKTDTVCTSFESGVGCLDVIILPVAHGTDLEGARWPLMERKKSATRASEHKRLTER